jgi:hypothetical protein
MKKLLLLLIFISGFLFGQTDTLLTFSEVMFYPQSGNNEFIEIYNLSETQSIDLSGYKIKYYTSNADVITDAGFGTVLQPKSFAVILEGDYDFASGIYNNLIPPNALKLKISDNSFGSSGMANTTSRPIWLINSINDTLDFRFYSANNSQAFSDEKILMNKDSSDSNWANGLTTNGSPGSKNSVTPSNYDLSLNSIRIFPEVPFQGDNVEITATVKNIGIMTAPDYSIEIFNDANFNSIPETGEIIFTQSYLNLTPNDSIDAVVSITNAAAGNYQIISRVIFSLDENSLNNQKIKSFSVYPPAQNYNDIVINEIMYAPSSGEPEWLEIFNRTSSSINLKKWKFSDNSSTVTITSQDLSIPSGSFLILTKDSSVLNFYNIPVAIVELNLPALNNTGDAVVIKDSLGVLIDSLFYLPDWGGNIGGKSLERISPDFSSTLETNWGTSVSIFKGTPGIINSLTPKANDLKLSAFESEKLFVITGEPISFNFTVKNIGLNVSSAFNISFFRDANLDSIAQTSEFIGSFNANPLLPNDSLSSSISTNDYLTGQNSFIAKVVVVPDDDTTNNSLITEVAGVTINEARNDLVINEIMYAPKSAQPEWIEIFNRSSKVINLKNYQLADNNDSLKVVDESILLNPGEYLVFASDSSILSYFNIPSKLVVNNIPSLNNSGDKLILIDSLSRVIDSLFYFPDWGGKDGFSLERLNTEFPSIDSLNWGTTRNRLGGTPGSINSITVKDFDVELSTIIFDPPFPLKGSNVNPSVKVKNIGKNSANFEIQFYEDTNLDSIPDLLLTSLGSLNLAVNDSAIYSINYLIENLQNKRGFFARAIFNQDQDTTNNYFYKTTAPGYQPLSITINEILFTPTGGEPEWIEFYNNTDDSINLKDWSITDIITTPVTASIKEEIFVDAKSYFVVSRDTTIKNYHRLIPSKIIKLNLPTLNNDADGVVLKDLFGSTVDSVYYNSDWGGTNGLSLERKSLNASSNLPANWGSSEDNEQSTPGRINSLTPIQFDLSASSMSFDPRFPVSGDNIRIIAKVKNNGSSSAGNFQVQFFFDSDSNNIPDQLLSTQSYQNLLPGDSVFISSANTINNLQKKIFAAIKILYDSDEDTLNNYLEKSIEPGFPQNIVKVNEVMYDPDSGKPEWFELVNISNYTVNIKDWAVSDILTTPTKSFISNAETNIEPGEYFIISKDTSFFRFYPEVISKVFIVNFGTLGNSADGIILYDFRNGIIDSLFYRSSWGGLNGYSLERFSFEKSTNDSLNWTTSLNQNNSTPGAPNSLLNIPDYERNQIVINEIMYDPDIDNSEFVEFLNTSNDSVNLGGWRIEDEKGNFFKLSETTLNIPPDSYFVLAADSLVRLKYSLNNYPYVKDIDQSSLGLTNSGEMILLKDVRGNVIDSVFYFDSWNNKNISVTRNKSLERINPLLSSNDMKNWSTSVEPIGATPAAENSIYTVNLNTSTNISVSPNPFSPDNDGFEDFTIINYSLTQTVAQVRIKIFDSTGRLVRTLANNQASGSNGSVIFDGLGDDGQALRIGIYIVFLEALNQSSGVIETLKTVVVVARKL